MTPQAPSLLAVAAAASGKEVTTQFLSKHDLELIEINKKKSATVGILEHLEKSFRETMEFRRLQNKPHSYFIGGEGATAAAAVEGVSTPMDTLFMVARDEIASFKKKQEAENAAKLTKKAEAEETLKLQISQTRDKFRRKEHIIKNGPTFRRHFTSMFGNVMLVSYVTKNILIVVGSQGTIELWDVRVGDDENYTNLIELHNLERGEVTSVDELTHFDSELLSPEQLLAEETQATEEVDPNDPFGEIKPNPDKLGPGDVLKTTKYLISFISGQALIFEVKWKKTIDDEILSHSIISEQRISCLKLTLTAFLKQHDLILAVCCRPRLGYQLMVLNMKLEILWECTISDIEAACNARTSKSIPFLESPCVIHDDEFPANRQMSPPGKLNLTHLNVCEHDGKILGALSTGEVFTMVYDAFTTTQKITDKNGEASEIQLMNRSFVISQLLKVKAVKLVSKAIVTRNEDGNEDVPVAGVATTSGKSTFTAVQFEDEEDEVQIMSLTSVYNLKHHKTQVIIGCSDGSLRSYSMEKLAFRSAETHGALRDSNEQPFLYQWEEAVPWKSRDKISKHDTTSFVMDNEGAIKVEFPTWLETITLPDEKTQYLLALTEEVYVYVFDINSAAPLIDMRIVATHSMHKGEPRLIAFKRNPGLAAICRGKEWSIMHGGVYLGSWATGDDDQKKTRLNNTPFFGMPSTTNVSESGGHENLTTKTTASGIAEVGRANAGGGMAVLQGGSGLVVPPTNNTASSSSRSSEAAAEGTLSPSPGNADDVLATMQSFAMVGGGAVGTVLSENIAEEDEEEEEENTREDEDQQD